MELHSLPAYIERGQLVEVDSHVTGVIEDIRAISPRIHIFWNEQGQEFDLVEYCLNDEQRLIFSVKELDARVVDRLRLADQWRGREDSTHVLPEEEDFLTQMDADNEALEATINDKQLDKLRDAGERLAWAGEQDRRGVHAQISVPRAIDG